MGWATWFANSCGVVAALWSFVAISRCSSRPTFSWLLAFFVGCLSAVLMMYNTVPGDDLKHDRTAHGVFSALLYLQSLGNSLWFAADQYYILRDIQLLPEREQKTVLRRIHLVIWSCCFVWVFVPLTINGYEPGFEMTPWAFVLTLGPHCLAAVFIAREFYLEDRRTTTQMERVDDLLRRA